MFHNHQGMEMIQCQQGVLDNLYKLYSPTEEAVEEEEVVEEEAVEAFQHM